MKTRISPYAHILNPKLNSYSSDTTVGYEIDYTSANQNFYHVNQENCRIRITGLPLDALLVRKM